MAPGLKMKPCPVHLKKPMYLSSCQAPSRFSGPSARHCSLVHVCAVTRLCSLPVNSISPSGLA